MIKIEDNKLELEILNLFESGLKKRKIAKLLGISTSYIDRVLLEKGKPKRVFCTDPGFVIVAKCRKTGKQFDDYENKSGIITSHVIEHYPDFAIPTPYKRRKSFKENNRFWYEQLFDLIQVKVDESDRKKCMYCEWSTTDLKNKSGWYTTHLSKVHGKSIDEYVLDFPEERILFKTHFSNSDKKNKMLSSDKNYIECKICGEKMSKITNTHLKSKHNLTLTDYRILHQSTLSESSLNKFKKIYDENLRELSGNYVSRPQMEISNFITDLGFTVDLNNKSVLSGIELDILIKDKNLAIEFDGLYFHSEISGNKTRLYHRSKTELAKSKGIRLIHVFEDEWQNKREIVKSKIRHLLGCSGAERIHARKMTLRKITKQEADVFLEKNHIQGTDDSAVCLGAFYEEALYAVMTFDNKRRMNMEKNHDIDIYELKRYATDINFLVPGAASRLLGFFISEFTPKRIISFADLRWSSLESNLYSTMGFRLEKTLAPDYSYTFYKSGVAYRFHKFGFGKKSIMKKYPEIYSPEKTEWEMMREKGFDRVWDCGKLKYSMEL